MLDELAIHFRFLQLYTHNAHNLVSGVTFFEDHEFLGGLYPIYEAAYDASVERMLGLGEVPNLLDLQLSAVKLLKTAKSDWLTVLLSGEKVIGQLVEKCFKEGEYTQGTLNLVAQFADDSEARQYKLKQRSK